MLSHCFIWLFYLKNRPKVYCVEVYENRIKSINIDSLMCAPCYVVEQDHCTALYCRIVTLFYMVVLFKELSQSILC